MSGRSVITQHKQMTWRQSAWFAARRMFWTMSVGLAVAAIWVIGLLAAPQIEARLFPAISDVRILPEKARLNDPDLLAFRVEWTSNCECRSLGRSWFFRMSDGSMIRVQAQQPEGIASPSYRPRGRQIGRLMILRVPEPREGVDQDGRASVVEAEAVVGTSAYERGLPWQSQVTMGPYPVALFRRPAPIDAGAAEDRQSADPP